MSRIQKIVIATCLLGYFLILQAIYNTKAGLHKSEIGFCVFKKVTGLPCPSCGGTRAVLLLLQGKLIQSILLNPIGCLILIYLLVAPIWLLVDFFYKKKSLEIFYKKVEFVFKKKLVMLGLITLIIINWIWNISKNL